MVEELRGQVTAGSGLGGSPPRAYASGRPLHGDERTLSERLQAGAGASSERGVTFAADDHVQWVSWARLHEEARALAAVIQERGIGRGSHVALLGTTSRELVTAVLASWLAGATVVVLPLPMRLESIEKFVAQTRARLVNAHCSLLAADPLLSEMADSGPVPLLGLDEAARLAGIDPDAGAATCGRDVSRRAERFVEPQMSPDDLALLQFTSGSTADPKGVMIPHRQLGAQIDAATESANFDPDGDVMVSWLPLYHDMGLVGFLAVPACCGTSLVIGSAQEFTGSPLRWMQWVSAYGGTVTAGPSFAYALATRALRSARGLDLSRMRIALNGGEPVDVAAVEGFSAAAGGFGFPSGAVFCAFGMAEATLAVTFPKVGSGLRVDTVDAHALENEKLALPARPSAPARRLALLGRPIAGLELRVVHPEEGSTLMERQVGEVEVRGACITPGYYSNPSATDAAFRDGWLRSGDLGYLVDGELVLCGRRKDVIIISGRNVFPEEAERAAGSVDGVRAGNVITFGVQGRGGRERLVVVAEVKEVDSTLIRSEVARRVRDTLGLPPSDVVLVAPSTLPKTSSGKLQRSLCRERYLKGSLALAE